MVNEKKMYKVNYIKYRVEIKLEREIYWLSVNEIITELESLVFLLRS